MRPLIFAAVLLVSIHVTHKDQLTTNPCVTGATIENQTK